MGKIHTLKAKRSTLDIFLKRRSRNPWTTAGVFAKTRVHYTHLVCVTVGFFRSYLVHVPVQGAGLPFATSHICDH